MTLFYNCSDNNNSQNTNTNIFTLTANDTINIAIGSEFNYSTVLQPFTIDNNIYMGGLVRTNTISYTNTFVLLDYNKKKIYKKLNFKKEGPNGIGTPAYIKIINWDSIFVFQYQTTNIYLTDSACIVKDKWKINKFNENIITIAGTFFFPVYFIDNKLYMEAITPHQVFTDDFWKQNTELVFNIKTNKLINKAGHYPDIYRKSINYGGGNIFPNRIITNSGEIVYGFSLNNKLYIYNDSTLLKTVECRSKHVKEDAPKPSKKLTGYNPEDDIAYEVQRASYRFLFYDKYRDLIYRVVLHASDLYDKYGNKVDFWNRPFSIQIINNKYELIGEVDFPGNTYFIKNIIPVPEGVLISTSNEKNPNLQEDRLQFVLFEIVNSK